MTISTKLPLAEHNEESIFLGFITAKRKYKATSKAKHYTIEEMKIEPNEGTVFKGVSHNVVLHRKGMIDRICRKTGWKKDQNISICKIEFSVYLGQGVKEPLVYD